MKEEGQEEQCYAPSMKVALSPLCWGQGEDGQEHRTSLISRGRKGRTRESPWNENGSEHRDLPWREVGRELGIPTLRDRGWGREYPP